MQYKIQHTALTEVLGLLSKRLAIRITFFDVNARETAADASLPMARYCALRRLRSSDFNARCVECDQFHLRQAREIGKAVVYHCHAGLLEGVVPLYNRQKFYLGSMVFGQIAERGGERGYPGVQEGTRSDLEEIARLLKIVGEYMIQQEMIRLMRPQWAEKVGTYLRAHWNEKISLAALAKLAGISTSQMSHSFALEFGLPLRRYLKKIRLEQAKLLLEGNASVKEAAAAAGFYDEFHLSKAFKAEYGYPPIQLKSWVRVPPAEKPRLDSDSAVDIHSS